MGRRGGPVRVRPVRRLRRQRGGRLTAADPPDALVGEAADELYGLPPDQFTAARDERVLAARSGGDRKLAAALARLRKPTVSAWVLNLLVRDQPEVGEQLVSLGHELRRAQEELSGAALRELATQRQRLVAALVHSARQLAAREGHPVGAATAYEVEQTLHAAMADPDVAREVGSGRLTRAASRSGFEAEAPAAPAPRPKPERRLRVVRDEEPGEDPAAARERRRREREQDRREQERERLQEELAAAERARGEAEEAFRRAEDRLEEAERERARAGGAVDDLRRQLAGAEDAERTAVRAEREAQRTRDAAARRRDSTARKSTDLAARLADLEV